MTNSASTKPATAYTADLNSAQVEALNLSDDGDFEAAKQGFLGSIEGARITNDAGEVVWDLAAYVFLETETAGPVNRASGDKRGSTNTTVCFV